MPVNQSIDFGPVRVESGVERLDAYPSDPFWTQGGTDRERTIAVRYKRKFKGDPVVVAGITALADQQGGGTRIVANVEDITNESFNLVLKTWGPTLVGLVQISWLAVGNDRKLKDSAFEPEG